MVDEIKFDQQVRQNYKNLVDELIKRKLTITFMESATGGQLASLISDNEGSSAVLKGSLVTYSNEAKIIEGVDSHLIDKYSVYSKEVALSMAKAVNKTYPSDIAIGITGLFNNVDPANNQVKATNEVYFAILYKGKENAYFIKLEAQKIRLTSKLMVADSIYQELMKIL